MKIWLSGSDGLGWALDVQRQCVLSALERLGHSSVANPLLADLVLTVHWMPLILRRYGFLRFKRTATLATNFIDLEDPGYRYKSDFDRVNRLTTAWIAPSSRQQRVFEAHGVRSFYQPFYPDPVFFNTPRLSKPEICARLGIDYGRIAEKVVIGCIQRDTERDLVSPKIGKGPVDLVEMVASLPNRNRFVLLLAGPRRHYVVDQCRKRGIPYIHAGKEPESGVDDLLTNMLPAEVMPLLYQLIDVYIVPGHGLEGGPKAVMESALSRTYILAPDVGLAPDFLKPEAIVSDRKEFAVRLREVLDALPSGRLQSTIDAQHQRAVAVLNEQNMDGLLESILEGVARG